MTAVTNIVEHFTHNAVQERVDNIYDDLRNVHSDMIRLMARQAANYDKAAKASHINAIRLSALELRELVNGISDALTTLVTSQRVTPALLPPSKLKAVWQEAHNFLEASGFKLELPMHALYELPASFEADPHNSLTIFVQIPLVEDSFQLLRLLPFPVPLANSNVPVIIHPSCSILAVSKHATKFWEMSAEELNGCITFGTHYFCKAKELRKDVGDSCLMNLHQGAWQQAIVNCNARPYTRTWAVIEADSRVFHFYNAADVNVRSSCNTQGSVRWPAGFHNLTVASNCTFETPHFVIPRELHMQKRSVYTNKFDWLTPALPAQQALPKLTLHDLLPDPDPQVDPALLAAAAAAAATLILVFATLCCCRGRLMAAFAAKLHTAAQTAPTPMSDGAVQTAASPPPPPPQPRTRSSNY